MEPGSLGPQAAPPPLAEAALPQATRGDLGQTSDRGLLPDAWIQRLQLRVPNFCKFEFLPQKRDLTGDLLL